MENWSQSIQQTIDIIDRCIRQQEDEALTLRALSAALGYSESYVSRKFRALSGMSLRDYLRFRHLAFALRDVRDTSDSLLEIAVRYGFSSHEAFTRAFRAAYGVTPQRVPPAPDGRRPPHHFEAFRLLSAWHRRNGHGNIHRPHQDVFHHHSGAQVPAHPQLREHRLLRLLAEAKPDSGAGLGDHLRLAGAHPPAASIISAATSATHPPGS